MDDQHPDTKNGDEEPVVARGGVTSQPNTVGVVSMSALLATPVNSSQDRNTMIVTEAKPRVAIPK